MTMPTCSECRKWKPVFPNDGEAPCHRKGARGVFQSLPLTWNDCTCPDFEKRESPAERAARRCAESVKTWEGYTRFDWLLMSERYTLADHFLKIIQEEMEKGK